MPYVKRNWDRNSVMEDKAAEMKPKRYETLLEKLERGKAVGMGWGNVPELKKRNIARIHYSKDNISIMIEKMENFLTPEQIRERFGHNVFKQYASDFPHMLGGAVDGSSVYLRFASSALNRTVAPGEIYPRKEFSDIISQMRQCGTRLSLLIKEEKKKEKKKEVRILEI